MFNPAVAASSQSPSSTPLQPGDPKCKPNSAKPRATVPCPCRALHSKKLSMRRRLPRTMRVNKRFARPRTRNSKRAAVSTEHELEDWLKAKAEVDAQVQRGLADPPSAAAPAQTSA